MTNHLDNPKKLTPFATLLCLGYPIWGTVLFIFLISLFKTGSMQNALFWIGFISFVIVSPIPFFKSNMNPLMILLITAIYAIVMVIPVFFVGWMSYCWFMPSCH